MIIMIRGPIVLCTCALYTPEPPIAAASVEHLVANFSQQKKCLSFSGQS